MSAPTEPSVRMLPVCGNMRPETILSNVDLPAPFAPTMPTDSPGWISNEMSRSTQRHGLSVGLRRRITLVARLTWSRNKRRPRSTRNRFQTCWTLTEPSADIGEAGLEPLEHHEGADEPDARHDESDDRVARHG